MLKFRPYTYSSILSLLIVVGALLSYYQVPVTFTRKAYIDEFKFFTGVLCWVFISLNIIIAARPCLIGKLLPLDAWYKMHKVFGIYAAIFTTLHFFGKDIAIAVLDMTISFPEVTGASPPNAMPYKNFAKDLGEYITYLALVLFAISFISKISYKHWYYTHKLFSICYIALLFHAYYLTNDIKHTTVYIWFVDAITILATIAAFILLFNFAGGHRRFKAKVLDIKHQDNTTLLELEAQNNIAGNVGNFYFLKYNKQNFHPFSAYNIDGNKISFLIKGYGAFTKNVANLKNNDEVVVEGPYGDFEPLKAKGHNVLYFAQGVGIAPFAGTLIRLAKQNTLDFKLHVMLLSHEGRDDSSCKYLQDTLAQLEQKGVNVNYYNIKQDGYFDEAKAKVLLDNGFDSIYYCGSSQLGKLLAKVYKQQGGNLNNFYQEFCNWR